MCVFFMNAKVWGSLRLDANQVNAVAQSWLEIVSGFNPDIPHIRADKLCKIKNQQKQRNPAIETILYVLTGSMAMGET